jgi:uncharacterized spore protein YtfJ
VAFGSLNPCRADVKGQSPEGRGFAALVTTPRLEEGRAMGNHTNDTSILETVKELVQNTTAEKVYGTPVIQEGIAVLPVAKVSGGGGGGSGTGPGDDGHEAGGTGGGLGLTAKPLGVYVIREDRVDWRPAVDVNKAILGGMAVLVAAIVTAGVVIKARMRRAPVG